MNEQLNRKISAAKGSISDWTGNDEANCLLFDEMPYPLLYKSTANDEIACCVDQRKNMSERKCGMHKARRIAVCLAWCRWKGINLEGII